MRRTHRLDKRGFTLVELLTVIGIIAIMLALLLPTLQRVRVHANAISCASNLSQLGRAFHAYMIESRNVIFWRGENLSLDGMDWYVWGGRETGNTHTGQEGLFNRITPRPLNPHVGYALKVFHCPSDDAPFFPDRTDSNHFEWVGNSYNFNANGYPLRPPPDAGLAGKKITEIRESSRVILFFDAAMMYGINWHTRYKGNMCMLDGHVAFTHFPSDEPGEDYLWN